MEWAYAKLYSAICDVKACNWRGKKGLFQKIEVVYGVCERFLAALGQFWDTWAFSIE